MREQRTPERPSRPATSAALRALATFIALLLAGSSLSQVAHFVLVPHAICAEHGELLELSERPAHAAASARALSSSKETQVQASSSETGAHDHCQLLARNQRQQGQPSAPFVGVTPAAETQQIPWFAGRSLAVVSSPLLLAAPKTSPPLVSLV